VGLDLPVFTKDEQGLTFLLSENEKAGTEADPFIPLDQATVCGARLQVRQGANLPFWC